MVYYNESLKLPIFNAPLIASKPVYGPEFTFWSHLFKQLDFATQLVVFSSQYIFADFTPTVFPSPFFKTRTACVTGALWNKLPHVARYVTS